MIIKIDQEDEAAIHETLLGVCAQFSKPQRVVLLCRRRFYESLDRLANFFRPFVEILVVRPQEGSPEALEDIFFGCAPEICRLLANEGIVSIIDSRTVIFPNYVSDFKKFFVYCFGDTRTIAVLDMNYAVSEDAATSNGSSISARLVPSQKTETVEAIVPYNFIPLSSLALPIGIFRSVLEDHRYGSMLHDVFFIKLLERGRFFFLRRFGGFIKTSPPGFQTTIKSNFEDIAVLSEFFRSPYPFSFLFMNKLLHDDGSHNEILIGFRERQLARKLSRYGKLVSAVFWLHSFIRKLRNRLHYSAL
jgi:hypothetical protein